MFMKTTLVLCFVALALITGCVSKSRSISQSGYHDAYPSPGAPSRELDEFDVLGLDRNQSVTEADIQEVINRSQPVRLKEGSTILLIQSGALYPDGPMVEGLSEHFRIVPFTGMAPDSPATEARWLQTQSRNVAIMSDPDKPPTVVPLSNIARERYQTAASKTAPGAYSRTLRLAAARAGASAVVCYWGVLESGTEEIATKTVSWVPGLNWVVPDERQHMRIRLKIAVVDVATGDWSVFSGKPFETKKWSVRSRREVADQKQVESLKQRAYELTAGDFVSAYTGTAPGR